MYVCSAVFPPEFQPLQSLMLTLYPLRCLISISNLLCTEQNSWFFSQTSGPFQSSLYQEKAPPFAQLFKPKSPGSALLIYVPTTANQSNSAPAPCPWDSSYCSCDHKALAAAAVAIDQRAPVYGADSERPLYLNTGQFGPVAALEGLDHILRSMSELKPCGGDFDWWETGYGSEPADNFCPSLPSPPPQTLSWTQRFHTVSLKNLCKISNHLYLFLKLLPT